MPDRRQIAQDLEAPLDRWLFFPAAHALHLLVRRLPITPNQITALHLAIGLSTFWWLAKPSGPSPAAAFATFMIRNVLDCLDGVVARARNMTSPAGKVLDEWSDALSAIAVIAGVAVAGWRAGPSPWIPALAVVTVVSAGIAALQNELCRRRVLVAIQTGRDAVLEGIEGARRRRSTGLGPFGLLAEATKLRLAAANRPAAELEAEARFLHRNADSGRVRALSRVIALGGGDNALAILLLCMLAGWYVTGLAAMAAYSLGLSAITVAMMNACLAGARTETR